MPTFAQATGTLRALLRKTEAKFRLASIVPDTTSARTFLEPPRCKAALGHVTAQEPARMTCRHKPHARDKRGRTANNCWLAHTPILAGCTTEAAAPSLTRACSSNSARTKAQPCQGAHLPTCRQLVPQAAAQRRSNRASPEQAREPTSAQTWRRQVRARERQRALQSHQQAAKQNARDRNKCDASTARPLANLTPRAWTHWGLNPGPSACKPDVIPLHHVPARSQKQRKYNCRRRRRRRLARVI